MPVSFPVCAFDQPTDKVPAGFIYAARINFARLFTILAGL